MESKKFDPKESGITDSGLLIRLLFCRKYQMRNNKPYYGLYVMPQWDGGEGSTGIKYKGNVWDKAAVLLDNNKIDPEEYIDYCLSSQSRHSPNMLLAKSSLAKFVELSKDKRPPLTWDLELRKLSQLIALRLRCHSSVDALTFVLNDNTSGVSSLARYCYAWANNCQYLCEGIADEAFKQYLCRRHFYEKHYGQWMPEKFKERAKGMLNYGVEHRL